MFWNSKKGFLVFYINTDGAVDEEDFVQRKLKAFESSGYLSHIPKGYKLIMIPVKGQDTKLEVIRF